MARAASSRLMLARGEAPKAMWRSSPARPCLRRFAGGEHQVDDVLLDFLVQIQPVDQRPHPDDIVRMDQRGQRIRSLGDVQQGA
jgi:hypothetical protein